MTSMTSYILEGMWIAKRYIPLGIIVFIAYQVILLLVKKRTIQDYKAISIFLLIAEFLLSIYVCVILRITGMIGKELYLSFSPSNLMGFLTLPFVGASIKMVTLNFLLFVPYGFLVCIVFQKAKLNWRKALIIGFCTSFCIELTQAFTGRLTELDDLIINTAGFVAGFLIAEAIGKIRDVGQQKKGISQILLVFGISTVGLFFLSFIANGDAIQEAEYAYYNGIAGLTGTSNEEIETLYKVNIYYNGDKYDTLEEEDSLLDEWYTAMGMDIDNKAGFYAVENQLEEDSPVLEKDKIYFEVAYSSPQLFRFYNNRDWVMEDVTYMIYCINNGELWYGDSLTSITHHAYYNSTEYPFDVDETLIEDINTWISSKDN